MIVSPRPWSLADRAYLRARYLDTPITELAVRLGRTVASIHSQADHLGIKRYRQGEAWEARAAIRRLHEAGHNASATGRKLGISRAAVARVLHRLGLVPHDRPGAARPQTHAMIAAGRDRRARQQGFRNHCELVKVRRRLRCESEFRGCVTALEVAICKSLRDAGPGTVGELTVRLNRSNLDSVRARLLALLRAGTVRRDGAGAPGRPYVYYLCDPRTAWHRRRKEVGT